MWESLHDDEPAKVLVFGDEHAIFAERQCEQFFVDRLGVSVQGRKDIMAVVRKCLLKRPRCSAYVQQEPHEAGGTGMRS